MDNNFTETKVSIHGKYDTGTTVTIPQNGGGKHPAVILVAGTGAKLDS